MQRCLILFARRPAPDGTLCEEVALSSPSSLLGFTLTRCHLVCAPSGSGRRALPSSSVQKSVFDVGVQFVPVSSSLCAVRLWTARSAKVFRCVLLSRCWGSLCAGGSLFARRLAPDGALCETVLLSNPSSMLGFTLCRCHLLAFSRAVVPSSQAFSACASASNGKL